MSEKNCSNCLLWEYNRFTEETYGMGIGVCGEDGSITFCSHLCVFCRPIEEEDNER